MTDIFNFIFHENDNIFITDLTADYGHYRQKICKPVMIEPRTFFCINPIAGNIRRKSEIKAYRNFLFEDDHTPIDEQIKLLPKIAALDVVACATFSAGKSIHYIISCSDTLDLGEPGSDAANEQYRDIWYGLSKLLTKEGLKVDGSNKNPVVLSRMPGSERNGAIQTLMHKGNLVTSDFLKSVAQSYIKPVRIISEVSATSLDQLEEMLKIPHHSHIRTYLNYPSWAQREHGNYPMIFRLASWAIDELGVPIDTFITYFEKHTAQHLLKKQYYKDWKKPIFDAYYHKGVIK